MPTISPRRLKLFLVTFDLNQPRPGDLRYRRVDAFLASVGTSMRPFKQTRLVVTSAAARSVQAGIRAIIGRRGNIAVLRISARSVADIADPIIRAAVRQALTRHGSP